MSLYYKVLFSGNDAYKKYFSSFSSDIVGVVEKEGMPHVPSASDRELQPSSRSNTPPVDDEFQYIPWEPDIEDLDHEFDAEIDISRKRSPLKRSVKKTQPKSQQRTKGERSYMNADDIQELEFLFKDYLLEKKAPRKSTIIEFLEKNKKSGGRLHRYSVEKIQKRLCNMVSTYVRKKHIPSDDE